MRMMGRMPSQPKDQELIATVARRIDALMAERQQTPQELSYELRIPVRQIYAWRGGSHLPSVIYLIQLAEHFNVTTDYLLGLSDDPQGQDADSLERHAKADATLAVLESSAPPDPSSKRPTRR